MICWLDWLRVGLLVALRCRVVLFWCCMVCFVASCNDAVGCGVGCVNSVVLNASFGLCWGLSLSVCLFCDLVV